MSKPRTTVPIKTPRQLWEELSGTKTGIVSIKDAVDSLLKKKPEEKK